MNKTYIGETLFPIKNIKGLKDYKYSGSDASILYKYVFGKAAQYLVDHVIPVWAA